MQELDGDVVAATTVNSLPQRADTTAQALEATGLQHYRGQVLRPVALRHSAATWTAVIHPREGLQPPLAADRRMPQRPERHIKSEDRRAIVRYLADLRSVQTARQIPPGVMKTIRELRGGSDPNPKWINALWNSVLDRRSYRPSEGA